MTWIAKQFKRLAEDETWPEYNCITCHHKDLETAQLALMVVEYRSLLIGLKIFQKEIRDNKYDYAMLQKRDLKAVRELGINPDHYHNVKRRVEGGENASSQVRKVRSHD